MAAGVLALLLAFQYLGHGLAARLGLVSRDQPFTELYFPQPTALPASEKAGQHLDFSFVIDNRQGSARSYRWTVLLTKGKRRLTLTSGTARLPNGRSRVIAVSVASRLPAGAQTVEVRLANPVQGIDFHLDVASQP